MATILSAAGIVKTFVVKKRLFKPDDIVSAVNGVSFRLREKEVLGVVGESGCGKSTLARILIGSIRPDDGAVMLDKENLAVKNTSRKKYREKCRKIQMVYQNPYSSLNPRMKIIDNVTFGLRALGMKKKQALAKGLEYLEAVGIKEELAYVYPRNLSGGQRQRVAIARALVMEPKVILADEPVSALDKSVQAQVLNLFSDLKEKYGISIIFISHDLSVVEYMSDRIIVMYLGEIVEKGLKGEICDHPLHPYTKELLSSVPDIRQGLKRKGSTESELAELPSPINPPSGCRFHPRCPYAAESCKCSSPLPVKVSPTHTVFCSRIEEFLHDEKGDVS